MLKALTVLLGVALAGVGLWVIVAELRRVTRARTWPTVTGRVLDSSWSAGAGESGSASSEVRVDYEYAVWGQRHTATTVIVTPAMSLERARKKGAEFRRLYPVGRELPIAYNPEQPAQSEMADEAQQATNYGMVLLGVLFFGFFIYLTYWAVANW